MARILWAFDITAPSDEAGHPILPSSTDFVDEGLVMYAGYLVLR